MFCARCGQQIPDASQVCPLCGREANIALPPSAAQAVPAPALAPGDAPASSTAPIRKDLQGVGGWLLLFCIGLVLLSPLLVLVEVMGEPNADTLAMALELSRAVFGIVVGIFIWNVRPVAFTLLWIYFAFFALLCVLGIVGFAMKPDVNQTRDLTLLIRSLLYTVGWFLYFKRSERVRATFGRNL